MRQTLFGASLISVQRLALNAISVPATALIIRRLGPDNYGRWSTAVALVAAVSILASLGLRGPFIRSVARDPDSAVDALADQLGLRGVLALLAATASLSVAILLHYPSVVLQCTAIIAFNMFVSVINTTLIDLLQGLEQFRAIAAAGFISGLALTVVSVIAVWHTGDPVWLACSYAFGPLVSLVVAIVYLRRSNIVIRARMRVGRGWQLIKDSRHFAFQQIVGAFSDNLPGLVLPRLVSASEFGAFSAGALVTDRLGVVSDAVETALFPSVSRLRRKEPARAAQHAIRAIIVTLVTCITVAIATAALSHVIAVVLLPKASGQCERVIMISIWSLPLVALASALGDSLVAAGREDLLSRASLISVTINLILGAVLLAFKGVDGACWFIVARPLPQIAFLLPCFLRFFVGNPSKPNADLANATSVQT